MLLMLLLLMSVLVVDLLLSLSRRSLSQSMLHVVTVVAVAVPVLVECDASFADLLWFHTLNRRSMCVLNFYINQTDGKSYMTSTSDVESILFQQRYGDFGCQVM